MAKRCATSCDTSAHRTPTWRQAACGSRGTCRRSEEHTSELQSRFDLVCRLLLEKKKKKNNKKNTQKKKTTNISRSPTPYYSHMHFKTRCYIPPTASPITRLPCTLQTEQHTAPAG